ncbi:hypothetical protein EMPS_09953 [Entomortierella parvispora]|uniref:Uncharacterized protein n=1 Tax=Entomortierella parvispora TaxID=205924 RepID=A0A9P3HJ03_9FUNG|nr:hypothetical protein EMPS_09953 [Entomortierella parvispora]
MTRHQSYLRKKSFLPKGRSQLESSLKVSSTDRLQRQFKHTKPTSICGRPFCDMNYDGDSTVSPTRMPEFFEKVAFERTVQKVVDPNAEYSGQIGIAAPGEGLRKGHKAARNKELDTRASTTTSSPMATSADVPAQSGPIPLDASNTPIDMAMIAQLFKTFRTC